MLSIFSIIKNLVFLIFYFVPVTFCCFHGREWPLSVQLGWSNLEEGGGETKHDPKLYLLKGQASVVSNLSFNSTQTTTLSDVLRRRLLEITYNVDTLQELSIAQIFVTRNFCKTAGLYKR